MNKRYKLGELIFTHTDGFNYVSDDLGYTRIECEDDLLKMGATPIEDDQIEMWTEDDSKNVRISVYSVGEDGKTVDPRVGIATARMSRWMREVTNKLNRI